jgi:hypothetical protein
MGPMTCSARSMRAGSIADFFGQARSQLQIDSDTRR